MKKIRLFEMFAGYGGASFALKKAGIPFDCVGYSEIDKFAIQCYNQNHNAKNYGDCTKINPLELPDFDLLTAGFPCQAFSVAGKGLGELDTRGTLFNEIIRIAEVKKPKYMLLENVKGLTTKKHKATFEKILSELERIGYNVKWKVLNSKEHSIPQNRERVFFVCQKKGEYINFNFPHKEELKIFLKDILEPEVDEKYFLSDKTVATLIRHGNKIINQDENPLVSATIHANYFKMGGRDQQYCIDMSQVRREHKLRVYDGISKCLNTAQGGGHTPLTNHKGRLRRFTPTECFRLMGFLDDNINLDGLSNTQRYKLAGNGWDINLVSKIFKKMFEDKNENNKIK